MKKFSIQFLLAALTLLLHACTSNGDEPTDLPTASSISATISGQAWASMPGAAIVSVNQSTFGSQQPSIIQIAGFSADQSSVSIQFPFSTIGVGTYTFNANSDGVLIYFPAGGAAASPFFSSNGTGNFVLKITAFDLVTGIMSGTFTGTVFDSAGASKTISNGVINSVKIISSAFYSNGTMGLKLNNGAPFTMDNDNTDGKFVMVSQNSASNDLVFSGYNTALTADFGIYSLKIPKNAIAGTYNVVTNANYKAAIGNRDNEPAYNITSGSITITSNMNKIMIGTFNFVANNGVTAKNISLGTFNFQYN